MTPPLPNKSSSRTLLRAPTYVLAAQAGERDAPAADGIDLSQLFTTLRRHRRLIFTIAVVTFGLVMGWTMMSHMRFASTAQMYLGELEDKGRPAGPTGEDDVDLSSGGHGDIGSEIEILKSRSLVTRAILDTGLNVTINPAGSKPPRYARWLISRRSPWLIDVASREVTAENASLTDRSVPDADFGVRFVTNLDYEISDGARIIGHGKLGQSVHTGPLTVTLMPGTERSPVAGARYDLTVESLDDVVDSALKELEVSTPTTKAPSGADSLKVARLHFASRSPRKAATFLQQLMLRYLEQRQAWKAENATAAESFVTSQLGKTRETLDQIQAKLAAYRAGNGVVLLDNEATAMIEQIGKIEEQRVAARLDVESLGAVQRQLNGPKPPLEAYMLGEDKEDSVLVGLAQSLSQAQQKLTEAETRFNAPAPTVRDLREQLDAQVLAIRSYVSTRLARAKDNLRMLDGIVAQYDQKLKTVPGAQLGLAQLTRESEVYSAMYSFLLKRQQETALIKASTVSKSRVLDPAQVPYREEPLRLIVALASAPFGLVFGTIVVFLRSALSSRLQHGVDVLKHVGPVPIFATVPRAVQRGHRRSPESLEAFRTLRANILDVCRRDRGNVVVFTSPCRGDGKTTCAYFLASTLARAGRTVLVVETGACASSRKRAAADPDAKGFGDVLVGRDEWRNVVREISVSPECTFQIIRGDGDESADLLSEPSMFEFIEEVREIL